jgi:hypothetical protein
VYTRIHSYPHGASVGRRNAGKPWNYAEGKKASLIAHKNGIWAKFMLESGLGAQLDAFYGQNTSPSRPLQQSSSDKRQSIVSREEAEILMDFFT